MRQPKARLLLDLVVRVRVRVRARARVRVRVRWLQASYRCALQQASYGPLTLVRIASRQSPTVVSSLPEPRSWARRQSYGVHEATSVLSMCPAATACNPSTGGVLKS